MGKVIDYKIVSVYGFYGVDCVVKPQLLSGWEPLGGPFVYNGNTCQAMVKYEEVKKPKKLM
jgi:hypothetical protein